MVFLAVGEIGLRGGQLARRCTFFLIHFIFFWSSFFIHSLVFWKTHKMDFWHKTLNTILFTSQKRIIFHQDFYFSHIYARLNENSHIYILWNHMNGTFHMELKWYNQLIFNIWLGVSSKLTVIWILLKYIFTNMYFNPLISIKF
jgi:hypothetical protein